MAINDADTKPPVDLKHFLARAMWRCWERLRAIRASAATAAKGLGTAGWAAELGTTLYP